MREDQSQQNNPKLLWIPRQSVAGLIYIPPPRRLTIVLGGRVTAQETKAQLRDTTTRPETLRVTPGGLIIVSSSRKREPNRIIGHPDLASGASVQRGETLYVSIAEAVYRESRGEEVELHFTSSDEDNEALRELRARARSRWENDRLPDGWTHPNPPPPTPKTIDSGLPEELRAPLEEFRSRQRHQDS